MIYSIGQNGTERNQKEVHINGRRRCSQQYHASSTDRFANMNPDRCVSEPQIDLIGFNEDVTGCQLETRIRTRSRGVPDHTDNRLRDDYTQLKVAVYEWGERVCSRAHPIDVIEREHNALCA